MNRHMAFGWLAVLVFVACGTDNGSTSLQTMQVPDSVLDRETYKAVFAEALLIEAVRKQRVYRNDNDSLRLQEAYQELFAAHDITKEQFERAQAWWFGQPEAVIPLLREVTESISDQERAWEAE